MLPKSPYPPGFAHAFVRDPNGKATTFRRMRCALVMMWRPQESTDVRIDSQP
jgi:hypothetical protein